MPDYNNTIIYRIVCKDANITDCYIGHTTNMVKRRQHHKCSCTKENNKQYNQKVYKFIRENGGWFNWIMIEIEKYPCNDVAEAIAREYHNYSLFNASLNCKVPSRTEKEWREDNANMIKEYMEKYCYENADKVKEIKKKWRDENPDKGKEYQKKYRDENPDKVKEKNKKYYEKKKNEKK